jgi:hypothetical protein
VEAKVRKEQADDLAAAANARTAAENMREGVKAMFDRCVVAETALDQALEQAEALAAALDRREQSFDKEGVLELQWRYVVQAMDKLKHKNSDGTWSTYRERLMSEAQSLFELDREAKRVGPQAVNQTHGDYVSRQRALLVDMRGEGSAALGFSTDPTKERKHGEDE